MISEKVYLYCKDDLSLIENYEEAVNDKSQTWECHHRSETDLGLTPKELKDRGLYFNRPASELIFLTKSEHRRLHSQGENNPFYNKTHSEEFKKKQSTNMLGKEPWNKGISPSEETRKKQSASMKGKTPWNKGKKGVQQAWNKGKKGVQQAWNKGISPSEETRKKQSEARKEWWKKHKKK